MRSGAASPLVALAPVALEAGVQLLRRRGLRVRLPHLRARGCGDLPPDRGDETVLVVLAGQLRPASEPVAQLVELAGDVFAGPEVRHRKPFWRPAADQLDRASQASTSISGGGVGGIVIVSVVIRTPPTSPTNAVPSCRYDT